MFPSSGPILPLPLSSSPSSPAPDQDNVLLKPASRNTGQTEPAAARWRWWRLKGRDDGAEALEVVDMRHRRMQCWRVKFVRRGDAAPGGDLTRSND